MSDDNPILLRVEALKKDGNAAFVAKDYETAVNLYTSAIDAIGGDPILNVASDMSTRHSKAILYGNRSAAKFSAGDVDGAAEDARTSAALDPHWAKAHVRLATALSTKGQFREAAAAFALAATLDPANAAYKRQQKEALAAAERADMQGPVLDAGHMLGILQRLNEKPRLRLATLAHWWNATPASAQPQGQEQASVRWHLFRELLSLVAGPSSVAPLPSAGTSGGTIQITAPSGEVMALPDPRPDFSSAELSASGGVHISRFPSQLFTVDLPLTVYADLSVPSAWLDWYSHTLLPAAHCDQSSAPAHGRAQDIVAFWRSVWDKCTTSMEQKLILDDFKAFYSPGSLSAGVSSAGSAGASSSLEGGEEDDDAGEGQVEEGDTDAATARAMKQFEAAAAAAVASNAAQRAAAASSAAAAPFPSSGPPAVVAAAASTAQPQRTGPKMKITHPPGAPKS